MRATRLPHISVDDSWLDACTIVANIIIIIIFCVRESRKRGVALCAVTLALFASSDNLFALTMTPTYLTLYFAGRLLCVRFYSSAFKSRARAKLRRAAYKIADTSARCRARAASARTLALRCERTLC